MDVLSVSQATARALSSLDDVSEGVLVKLCKHVLQRILLGSSTISIDESHSVAAEAVAALLLDAAKTRASDAAFRGVLLEQGLRPDVVEVLSAFYQQQAPTLTAQLQQTGISFPQIVGIDWRLDYDIKSRTTGKDGVPVFYVTLQTLNSSGQALPINFTASLEELQDLLGKVRDAVKEVDRVVVSQN